jgi:hypothetical protein
MAANAPTTTEEESITVLINDCYGGWNPSDAARKLYIARMMERNPEGEYDEHMTLDYVLRHDPTLVEIYHELGAAFDGVCCKTTATKIPKQFAKYYKIREYDGMEGIEIQYDKYLLGSVRTILNDESMTNDEKVRYLKEALHVAGRA